MSAIQLDDTLFEIALHWYQSHGRSLGALKSMPQSLRVFYTTRIMEQQVGPGSFNYYLGGMRPARNNESDLALTDLKLIGDRERADYLSLAKQVYATEMQKHGAMEFYMHIPNAADPSRKDTEPNLEDGYRKLTPTLTELRSRYAKTHLDAIEKALQS